MCVGLVLNLLFVSTLADLLNQGNSIALMPSYQKKFQDFLLQHDLIDNIDGMIILSLYY